MKLKTVVGILKNRVIPTEICLDMLHPQERKIIAHDIAKAPDVSMFKYFIF